MSKDLLDLAATPERIRALFDAGVIPPWALKYAYHLAVESPPRLWWRRFISISLMGLGSLLVLSGIIYFFAFNWADLHRFAKLGLLMGAITASALAAKRLGEGLAGRFALLFAAVLVGPLLAVYGQAYQTGADPYELFLGWALLILPWVALARFGPLWLLLLVLANVGLVLFWDQRLDWDNDAGHAALCLTLGLLNGFALATQEHFAFHNVAWLQSRWLSRVLVVMAVMPLLVVATWAAAIPEDFTVFHGVSLLALLLVAAGTYAIHRLVRSELFFLSVDAMAAMVLVTTFAGRHLLSGDGELEWLIKLFLMGSLIVCELGVAVWWLRTEARARGTEDV